MNWTEEDLQDYYKRRGDVVTAPAEHRVGKPSLDSVKPVEGPLSVTMVLHGHCPSKKNGWRIAGGKMIIPTEMKAQIEVLTQQAMFAWRYPSPVEHPDVTVRFFVSAAREDEDGMWTTVLDCLQKAGVLMNDNIAHFNGRKVHEPCEFVAEADERVEILICKT